MAGLNDFLQGVTNLLAAGREQEALANLKRAVMLNPTHPTLIATLGRVHWSVGNETEAEEQFNKALEIAPESISIQLEMADFLLAQDRAEDAHIHSQEAMFIDATYAPAQLTFARTMMQKGSDVEAKMLLFDLQPEDFEAPQDLMLAGVLILQQGDKERGNKFLKRAQVVFRDDAEFLLMLANMAETNKHFDLARLCLMDLIKKSPERTDLVEKLKNIKDK